MPVSSYIIRCPENRLSDVLQALAKLNPDQITVGCPTPSGIPVAADTRSTREASALGEHLQNLPGVSSAILVYHNFEDLEETNPDSPAPSLTPPNL